MFALELNANVVPLFDKIAIAAVTPLVWKI
jgi:hypothetical protein